MANTNKKIPYDTVPIVRSSTLRRNRAPEKMSLSLSVFVAAIFVFNVIISTLFIYYIFNRKTENTINMTYTIAQQDTSLASSTIDLSYATSKAKLSAVCVGAGGQNDAGTYSSSNLPLYSQMFNTDESSKSVASKGAGVIIQLNKQSGEAYIITCYHVVSDYTSSIFVLLYDSYQPVYAQLVGAYSAGDIAVLKIVSSEVKSSYCQAATIADSTYITEGEPVLAVGNPLGNGFSASTGVISKPSTMVSKDGKQIRCIQTDTAVNAGNSGGGLFDQYGNLVGLVNIKNTSSSVDNVAYALHSNMVINIAQNIIDGRNLQYAPAGYTIGVQSSKVVLENGKVYNFVNAVVTSVVSGSDVDKAGLSVGDVISSITYCGKTISFDTLYTYEEIKYCLKVGDTITYTISGSSKTVVVQVSSVAI